MFKRIVLLLLLSFTIVTLSARDNKTKTDSISNLIDKLYSERVETKMEAFISTQTGMLKFTDIRLYNRKTKMYYSRIRKIEKGNSIGYFYQITRRDFGKKVASIEYSDLLEVIKAIRELKSELYKDLNGGNEYDYVENKFTSEDWFQVGYFAKGKKKKKGTWYIILDTWLPRSTMVRIRNIDLIEQSFITARDKIEELKRRE